MSLPTQRPKETGGAYFKFKEGKNKIRIVSDLIGGESVWDKTGEKAKIIRSKVEGELRSIGDQKVKTFWAALIIDRDDNNSLKLFECDKASVINAFIELDGDESRGDLKNYDITITKHVTPSNKLLTKYTVQAVPPSALTKEELKTIKETPVDLDNMFVDASVFLSPEDRPTDDDVEEAFGSPPNAVSAPVDAPTAPPMPPSA